MRSGVAGRAVQLAGQAGATGISEE
jgi:hypothetical protein